MKINCWSRAPGVLACLLLAACAAPAPVAPPPPDAAYIVLGSGGVATARALVATADCPVLRADGQSLPMRTRSAPQTADLRPGQSKPAQFPERVCEAVVPPGAQSVTIGTLALAPVAPLVQRIVVLGDTGCRIKQSEGMYQDCGDGQAWPFREIAQAAAREHPDLVVHVGDYQYRESACPPGQPCAGSPWGYGWDAWNADLFAPARTLLAAAPWVVARGNHELCSRAGQGWFRLLDPAPYAPDRSCDHAQDDGAADFTAPYAVPLGGNWQIIVVDSSRASRALDRARPADAAAFARYEQDLDRVAELAAVPGMHSIFVSHHPVLGFSLERGARPVFGTPALLEPMRARNGTQYFPAGVELAIHGHVHTFQALDFRSAHPVTLITGHGGDLLDAELPDRVAGAFATAPGVQLGMVAHAGQFGYLVLQRRGAGWTLEAKGVDGASVARCSVLDRHLECDPVTRVSRPDVAADAGS